MIFLLTAMTKRSPVRVVITEIILPVGGIGVAFWLIANAAFVANRRYD